MNAKSERTDEQWEEEFYKWNYLADTHGVERKEEEVKETKSKIPWGKILIGTAAVGGAYWWWTRPKAETPGAIVAEKVPLEERVSRLLATGSSRKA